MVRKKEKGGGKGEKGSVEGRKQWQRGERNGRGERLMAHGDRKWLEREKK
jgi:hypothetical protein